MALDIVMRRVLANLRDQSVCWGAFLQIPQFRSSLTSTYPELYWPQGTSTKRDIVVTRVNEDVQRTLALRPTIEHTLPYASLFIAVPVGTPADCGLDFDWVTALEENEVEMVKMVDSVFDAGKLDFVFAAQYYEWHHDLKISTMYRQRRIVPENWKERILADVKKRRDQKLAANLPSGVPISPEE